MESDLIDVLLTKSHVILKRGAHSLWCARKGGNLLPGNGKQTVTNECLHLYQLAWGSHVAIILMGGSFPLSQCGFMNTRCCNAEARMCLQILQLSI